MKKHSSHPLPQRADGLALAALLFAGLCTIAAYSATHLIRSSLEYLGVMRDFWQWVFWITIAATALLFLPAFRSFSQSRKASAALASGDIVEARIQTAASRENGWVTFGWGAFALIALGFGVFVMMNDVAVGKTFFYLPLMEQKWWQVTKQFILNNIFIFVVAEALVLVWGLVVALARLMPGKAGQPIRALAIVYCDVFRGLPAIVTLYLIGFGIPTSGLPDLIVPHIVGQFVDLSSMSVAEQRSLTRIPVTWWCILALTLTYGAYVAEVYRSGIESIHWSQVSAARSLGLSYMQTMRYVVVPQAVRRIMAPLLNDFIGLQKDTALVQVVGVIDAFNQSRIIAANAFNLSAVTIVAILFVVITIPQARFVDRLIERDNARMRAGG
ncbi:amino acid ABC transporter permease [Aestuariivirga sp.]|uniref:amino acid ABC transporter permease n=1 Tax=Aestuariivirga sp. TaxID=2650926 RepID=UPI003BAC5AD3